MKRTISAFDLVCGAVVGAFLLWAVFTLDRSRRVLLSGGALSVEQAILWPGLNVGALVALDTQAANLPPEFRMAPEVLARVDMVLVDPEILSVSIGVPLVLWSGTVPRASIVRVVSNPPRVATV